MTEGKRVLYTIVFVGLLATGTARAEAPCGEGRMRSGECINPVLARVMRHGAIVRAQPKISLTAPLNLPSEDRYYPAARDHHEESAFYGFPAERPGIPRP